jgi:type IV secretion system protein VirB10
VLATRRFIIPKGNFLDCTLETAINSELPGMTTCITAFDIFGADGKVVLLERGSKLVGETRGQVAQGMSRLFILWSEARTPTGVVVQLDSPGTDELGRAGVTGNVNNHFWARFGAALLVTVIDGALTGVAQHQQMSGSTVILNPQGGQQVIDDILRNTINIPPTITVNQGSRIQVIVARDVDFRPVYELRTAATH